MGRPKSFEEKKQTSLYLFKSILEHAKDNEINLSQTLSDLYTEKFLSFDYHSNEYTYHFQKAEEYKKKINEKKKEIDDLIKTLNTEQIKFFLNEMPKQLKNPRIEGYNNPKPLYSYFCKVLKGKLTYYDFIQVYEKLLNLKDEEIDQLIRK